MNTSGPLIAQLFSIRNHFGKEYASQKIQLLNALNKEIFFQKKDIQLLYATLLFIIAYPDNPLVYNQAYLSLGQLQNIIRSNARLRDGLYNSGITNTQLCAAYSFEMVKWLRNTYKNNIRLISFETGDAQIQSIISVVMSKAESEILQDGNSDWRSWLNQSKNKGEDLLDRLIAVFNETDIRPEVKDELWSAIGINIEIDFVSHDCLPESIFDLCYHRSIIKKRIAQQTESFRSAKIRLKKEEAAQIIDCSRMILVRHLREIDPITFSSPELVSYYKLTRGISVALMEMIPERRHPIDSYMGYVVFKNGLPVAYAGSWILFDSARIGLNIFPAYRGGESQFIFEEVLKLHEHVYHLKRFSTDPYQIGKNNHDGIHSGAFWVYYHAGFRPIREEQKKMAEEEAKKIKSVKGYRTPYSRLKKLADSRLELMLKKNAVRFDATDLSLVYAGILKKQYGNKRKPAEEISAKKLATLLGIKNYQEMNMQYVLKNWSILLMTNEKELRINKLFKKVLKRIIELKANGPEEKYIAELQHAEALRNILETLVKNYAG